MNYGRFYWKPLAAVVVLTTVGVVGVRWYRTTHPSVEWESIGCAFSAKRMLRFGAPPDVDRLVLRGLLKPARGQEAPAELRPAIRAMMRELTPEQAKNMDAKVADYCERAA